MKLKRVRVERIDTAAKVVHAADGSATAYDHLVLATGSHSFIPPMTGVRTADGSLLDGVVGFRTIDETRQMLAASRTHRKAVVMGGGDSLASVARQEYGDPNLWRALAVANGVDDPMAVAPGRALVVPPLGEARDLAGARRA